MSITSFPGSPSHAWLMAIASGFERNGQTESRLVLFVMSMPMISGEETVTQAPKWERDSLRPMEIL